MRQQGGRPALHAPRAPPRPTARASPAATVPVRSAAVDMPYLASTLESSVRRNGKLGTRRGLDGNDASEFGDAVASIPVGVVDARSLSGGAGATLAKEGFELRRFDEVRGEGEAGSGSSAPGFDFLDHANVVKHYYPEVQALVAHVLGAAQEQVYCFDHNVRISRQAGAQPQQQKASSVAVQTPIARVHTDYTVTSAAARVQHLAEEPKANDAWRGFLAPGQSLIPPELAQRAVDGETRFVMLNVWRSISDEGPVQQSPLGVIDSSTVDVADLVTYEIHYADRIGENWFLKHSESHRWFYYSAMEKDDALVFKQWDSEGRLGRITQKLARGEAVDKADLQNTTSDFCPHGALPGVMETEHPCARASIETRVIAIF